MLVNESLGGSRPSLLHFPHDLPTTLGAGGLHLRAHRLHQRSHWCPAPTDGRGELNTEFGAQSGPILTGPTCFWNFNGEKREVMVNHEILVFTILNEAHFVFVEAHETKHGLMFFLLFFLEGSDYIDVLGPTNIHSCMQVVLRCQKKVRYLSHLHQPPFLLTVQRHVLSSIGLSPESRFGLTQLWWGPFPSWKLNIHHDLVRCFSQLNHVKPPFKGYTRPSYD